MPSVVKEAGSCGVYGEFMNGLEMGWEGGGSSSSTGSAGSVTVSAERKSLVDPIPGGEIPRCEVLDSVKNVAYAFDGRLGSGRGVVCLETTGDGEMLGAGWRLDWSAVGRLYSWMDSLDGRRYSTVVLW